MKLTYRPEIDGLRAIAIGAVILYHAQITILGHQPFKGGFIGVDIFFAISGYLITSIILKELVTTGSFSFKHFYERRIRRILPALLFVMLVSLPFAWMYLLPSNFIDFSKSILYSLGFSSNYYFWYTGHQYGAESGFLKPFLHTWSLSVEEQFYILFPIILLFTFKYFRKYLIHILVLGFIISLGLADYSSRNYSSASFYFLHTRIWELLAGSILAYFKITGKGGKIQIKILNLILPSVGLFLIGHSILFFNDKMFHPSFYTLSPIIGVCLIIWFSNENELITKILSTKLFVGIGLISYSLYLWHYPIFAFARVTEFTQGSLFNKLLVMITIILLSIISYYLIEKIFRNKKIKFKIIGFLIAIFCSVLIIFNLNIILKNGIKQRFPEMIYKINVEICKKDTGRMCNRTSSSNKKVFIMGDSIMRHISFALRDKLINNYNFIDTTQAGCLYFPGFDLVDIKTNRLNENCNNIYFSKLSEILHKEINSILIISGRFPYVLSEQDFDNKEGGGNLNKSNSKYISAGDYNTIQNSFKNEFIKLSKKNNIIFIYPVPEVGWNVPNRLNNILREQFKENNKNKKKRLKETSYVTTSYEVYKNRTKSSFELFDSIQGDNIYRVYPHILFCNTIIKDRCITHDDKNVFYTDHIHPSVAGAEIISNLIMKEIKKIELKFN
jgi:peptidoglycan/LPS O-acetylase OafA/YrhL